MLAAITCAGGWYVTVAPTSAGRTAVKMIENTRIAPWSNNERMIPVLQGRLRNEPGNPHVHASLGLAYLQKARETGDPNLYPKAELLFEQALLKWPDHLDALIGRATLAASRHDFEMARDIGRKAIAIEPRSAAAHGVLVDAFTELGDYKAAISTLDKMVKLKPDLASYSRIAYMRELHGDVTGAIAALEMAIRAGGPGSENTAWCIVQLGNLYLNSSRTAEAEAAYRAALGQFPSYVHALAGLARVAVAQKQLHAAANYYRQAIDRVPLPEFLIGLGETYLVLGKKAEGLAQFDLVSAIEDLQRRNGVEVDFELAMFHAEHTGQPESALAVARREYQRRQTIKTAEVLAWTLYRSGKHFEAESAIEKALTLGTKDPFLHYHAGMIFLATGREKVAAEHLEQALHWNPGFSPLNSTVAGNALSDLRKTLAE
jgi:tetratricopeptide (TPR) repeat protein